jgi:hypothetical protein
LQRPVQVIAAESTAQIGTHDLIGQVIGPLIDLLIDLLALARPTRGIGGRIARALARAFQVLERPHGGPR